jgi:hypothetical protein
MCRPAQGCSASVQPLGSSLYAGQRALSCGLGRTRRADARAGVEGHVTELVSDIITFALRLVALCTHRTLDRNSCRNSCIVTY